MLYGQLTVYKAFLPSRAEYCCYAYDITISVSLRGRESLTLTPRAHRLSCGYENDAAVTQQVIILGYTLSILIYLVIYTVAKT